MERRAQRRQRRRRPAQQAAQPAGAQRPGRRLARLLDWMGYAQRQPERGRTVLPAIDARDGRSLAVRAEALPRCHRGRGRLVQEWLHRCDHRWGGAGDGVHADHPGGELARCGPCQRRDGPVQHHGGRARQCQGAAAPRRRPDHRQHLVERPRHQRCGHRGLSDPHLRAVLRRRLPRRVRRRGRRPLAHERPGGGPAVGQKLLARSGGLQRGGLRRQQ